MLSSSFSINSWPPVMGVCRKNGPTSFGASVFTISHFTDVVASKKTVRSSYFDGLGEQWRLAICTEDPTFLSFFIEIRHELHEMLPTAEWSIEAAISLSLVHPTDVLRNVIRETHHTFTNQESDWGYIQFVALNKIEDYLTDDSLTFQVSIYPHTVYDHSDSSKEETGMVGLKNQGATCYMNSLLQTLYHLGAFRQSVYSMPTEKDLENAKTSIPLALQRVFYRLQFGNQSVSTKELTKSFGWDVADGFTQHDVQELNRVLCDNLEGKMKGTCSEGAIAKLFKGVSLSYISCMDIDFTSNRKEEFYDISLNVRSCKDIYESFDYYTSEEVMEGDNKYMAEGHGLQNARKGIKFISFPPVLFIQLKRFEFDYEKEAMSKINDKFSFTEKLDLSKYIDEREQRAHKKEEYQYGLYSVLVHNGDVHHGHYYSFQKPVVKGNETKWFTFNDETVTPCKKSAAIEANFGGMKTHFKKKVENCSSAYLLVYIQDSRAADILLNPETLQIPEHLKLKFAEEHAQEEYARSKRKEAKLYANIEIVTDKVIKKYKQSPFFDVFDFDLEPALYAGIRIKKDASIGDLKEICSHYFDIPVERQRLWKFAERENQTYRIDRPVRDDALTIGQASKNKQTWRLFIECMIPHLASPTARSFRKNPCLFIKFYKPFESIVEYVGSYTTSCGILLSELEDLIKKRTLPDLDLNTKFLFFEERSPHCVIPLSRNESLEEQEIGTGDIVVFQLDLDTNDSALYPTAPSYYDYFVNRIEVTFFPLLSGDNDVPIDESGFTIELSKAMEYEQVEQAVGTHLQCVPALLRFTGSIEDRPETRPIKKLDNEETLEEMISSGTRPILYYEILDTPLIEIESKKLILIDWQDKKAERMETMKIFAPIDATYDYVIKEVTKRVQFEQRRGSVRLMEVAGSKITRLIDAETPISKIFSSTIVGEEILPEEVKREKGDRIVSVSHGWCGTDHTQALRCFGRPFRCLSKQGEKISDFRNRVYLRLGLPQESASEWEIAMVAYQDKTFFSEDDSINDHSFHSHTYLILHHPNKDKKTRSSRNATEKAISIKY